jgi:hypothetical protein
MAHQPGVFLQESCGPIIRRDGIRSRANDPSICGKLLRNEFAWQCGPASGGVKERPGLVAPEGWWPISDHLRVVALLG